MSKSCYANRSDINACCCNCKNLLFIRKHYGNKENRFKSVKPTQYVEDLWVCAGVHHAYQFSEHNTPGARSFVTITDSMHGMCEFHIPLEMSSKLTKKLDK